MSRVMGSSLIAWYHSAISLSTILLTANLLTTGIPCPRASPSYGSGRADGEDGRGIGGEPGRLPCIQAPEGAVSEAAGRHQLRW